MEASLLWPSEKTVHQGAGNAKTKNLMKQINHSRLTKISTHGINLTMPTIKNIRTEAKAQELQTLHILVFQIIRLILTLLLHQASNHMPMAQTTNIKQVAHRLEQIDQCLKILIRAPLLFITANLMETAATISI